MLQQTQSASLPRRTQLALFARNFLKHPKMLGSVIPSSRYLIRQVLDQIDWEQARVIVEYGPGVGTFTTEILARMRPDARLVVFETNQEFVQFLRASVTDPRLVVMHGSAGAVGTVLGRLGLAGADYVVSGIPFSTMPATLRSSIMQATREALRPGGAFLVYQFSGSVLTHLRREFGHIEHGFEPRNLLPAHWYRCEVRADPVVS